MREKFARAVTLVALVGLVLLSGNAYAQSTDSIMWPSYHNGPERGGHYQPSSDINNPASLGMVWAFPRNVLPSISDPNTAVVDDSSTGFAADPSWIVATPSASAYNGEYYYQWATADGGSATVCRWQFPSSLPASTYQIWVWVPPIPPVVDSDGKPVITTASTQVRYTVYDDDGASRVPFFNQTQGVGSWQLLSTQVFSYMGKGTGFVGVQVSTNTGDTSAQIKSNNIVVMADAIKFVPTTGMEIYSSPATALMQWTQPSDGTDKSGETPYSGLTPFTFISTVENPLVSSSSPADTGAVYCVNSVTPTTTKISTLDPSNSANTAPDQKEFDHFTALANYLGTPQWKYPHKDLTKWAPLEGPVQGGFYSSPTLAYVDIGSTPTLVCFVTGMDGQVYALNAADGTLLFKGPGVTVSDRSGSFGSLMPGPDGQLTAPWNIENGATGAGRNDAVGGQFRWTQCTASTNTVLSTAKWDFTTGRTEDGEPGNGNGNGRGWAYNVYAWIPVYMAGEMSTGLARAKDATYTITYESQDNTGATSEATYKVVVDQSLASNQGRWVPLGTSFFNVKNVTLTNGTSGTDSSGQPAPNLYGVVANAVKIVPSGIGDFGYCTPVADCQYSPWYTANPKTSSTAKQLYAVCSGGRAMAFDLSAGQNTWTNQGGNQDCVGKLDWVYPHIRSVALVSGSADADAPSMGDIGASPAFYDTNTSGATTGGTQYLYIASTDGHIRCLTDLKNTGTPDTEPKPTLWWDFQDTDSSVSTGDSTDNYGFTSSPVICTTNSGVKLCIGSQGGYFYCLDALSSNPKGQELWRYPDNATDSSGTSSLPLGAFGYSTPAFSFDATTSGFARVWAGSQDGHVYSFLVDRTTGQSPRLNLDSTGAQVGPTYYAEPTTYDTIQGSVALDASPNSQDPAVASHQMVAYVGDMNSGTLHWYNAQNGLSDYKGQDSTGAYTGTVYTGYKIGGQLFSSPVLSAVPVAGVSTGKTVSWVYQGTSSGYLCAFSSNQSGAWGGEWNGGKWPFSGSQNNQPQVTYVAPNTMVQFDLFPKWFYNNASSFTADPMNSAGHYIMPPQLATPFNAGSTPPIWYPITSKMKLADPTSATIKDKNGTLTDVSIDGYLLNEGMKLRGTSGNTASFPAQAIGSSGSSTADTGVYFEQGESMYLMIWNLPDPMFLIGHPGDATQNAAQTDFSNQQNNINITFTNASAGDGAGASGSVTVSGKKLTRYTVLDASGGPLTEKLGDGSTSTYYPALKYSDGSTLVRRSYLTAYVNIDGNAIGKTPGPGWVLTATVRYQESVTAGGASSAPYIEQTIPIAKLTLKAITENDGSTDGKTYYQPMIQALGQKNATGAETNDQKVYQELPLGINNPLAITDNPGSPNGLNANSIAWGTASTTQLNRNDPEAHFNGNTAMVNNGTQVNGRGKLPVMTLDPLDQNGNPITMTLGATTVDIGVAHGSSSRQGSLGVKDRSAVSLAGNPPPNQPQLKNFRIANRDLAFRGGTAAITVGGIGMKFPWEQDIGSVDYPDIMTRNQSFLQLSTQQNPTSTATTLPPLQMFKDSSGVWNTTYPAGTAITTATDPLMIGDAVLIQANVPRFQPANALDTSNPTNTGYGSSMRAFVDANGNGKWDSGSTVRGRPSLTGAEAYRRFRVQLGVPPDPKIEVEEQLVDVGTGPHGLGQGLNYFPFNPDPSIQQWFKKLTIKNAGNVNLWNVQIGRNLLNSSGSAIPLNLYSDSTGYGVNLPGGLVQPSPGLPIGIVSSLDPPSWTMPAAQVFKSEPFATTVTSPPAGNVTLQNNNLGYTLTKARVGDPDPTILSVPDQRKWDVNYNHSTVSAMGVISGYAPDTNVLTGYTQDTTALWRLPSSSPLPVEVGVVAPLTQPVGTYSVGFVPVYCDLNYNGKWDLGEPCANPSFQLKATVKETQLTGGITPRTLTQIDNGSVHSIGDASPAAYRDAQTNAVNLFWSSNRLIDATKYSGMAAADLANAPWFLNHAALDWDSSKGGWQTQASGSKWWIRPDTFIPAFQWPSHNNLVKWDAGGTSPQLYSVRHFSPVIGELEGASASQKTGVDWLAWVGTANKLVPSDGAATNKINQENLIFYTDATGGDVESNGTVQSIEHDLTMTKRHPSMSLYKPVASSLDLMWMFWQGGDNGRWSIYYSSNSTADHRSNDGSGTGGTDYWSADTKLITPECLSTAVSPNALHRVFWQNLGVKTTSVPSLDLMDVVYSGTGRLSKNADIMLGRYMAEPDPKKALSPGKAAMPMPRTYNEKLQRDAKYNYYTSQHLAWIRLDTGETPVVDNWGNAVAAAKTDLPFIHVVFPAGYTSKLPDGTVNATLAAGAVISATDGSATGAEAAAPIVPQVDSATGVYTYTYPADSTAAKVLGQMLVDFSSGIVRFTKNLNETMDSAKNPVVPEVRADYTPQTWRLTTDAASDNSPRAFIERTKMNSTSNPGLVSSAQSFSAYPVDRLWVLWRRAGTGIESSTIFYKTYRVGIDLAKLGYASVKMAASVDPVTLATVYKPASNLDITGNFGPWEVNSTGSKIFFTGIDERYDSISTELASQTQVPGAITAIYNDINGNKVTVKATDVFWQEELPEQSLLGSSSNINVNEGSIYAFADPLPYDGTLNPLLSSKIWVFWTSTRSGTSDLFWETLSPSFVGR